MWGLGAKPGAKTLIWTKGYRAQLLSPFDLSSKNELCPILKFNNFIVVREWCMNAKLKLWQVVTVWCQWKHIDRGKTKLRKNMGKLRGQNLNIISTYAFMLQILGYLLWKSSMQPAYNPVPKAWLRNVRISIYVIEKQKHQADMCRWLHELLACKSSIFNLSSLYIGSHSNVLNDWPILKGFNSVM